MRRKRRNSGGYKLQHNVTNGRPFLIGMKIE